MAMVGFIMSRSMEAIPGRRNLLFTVVVDLLILGFVFLTLCGYDNLAGLQDGIFTIRHLHCQSEFRSTLSRRCHTYLTCTRERLQSAV